MEGILGDPGGNQDSIGKKQETWPCNWMPFFGASSLLVPFFKFKVLREGIWLVKFKLHVNFLVKPKHGEQGVASMELKIYNCLPTRTKPRKSISSSKVVFLAKG